MNILTKLQSIQGRERYEVYFEIMHRSRRFHENHNVYYPIDMQYKGWLWMDKTVEGCIVGAVGSSKTLDTVQWLILRVLMNPYEKWVWMAAEGGQLTQAMIYFTNNPFVKGIEGTTGKKVIMLKTGAFIYIRNATTGIAGLRLDGIILDEEEMLEPNQVEFVYPQLHARLANSSIGKFFHLGTMLNGTLFMRNIEKYPVIMRPWDDCPWLVKAGKIQRYIDEKIIPEWELNMLYRCIPTVPGGLFFHNLRVLDITKGRDNPLCQYDPDNLDWGFDFGGKDSGVGVFIEGTVCTIAEEREVDIESNHAILDDLKGNNITAEGGMYNDDVRYSAKCQILVKRLGAKRILPTRKWKKLRKLQARGFTEIRIIKQNCKRTLLDMQSCMFDVNGLWLKDKKHPCHWVDGFMLAINCKNRPGHYFPPDRVKERTDIMETERLREEWYKAATEGIY